MNMSSPSSSPLGTTVHSDPDVGNQTLPLSISMRKENITFTDPLVDNDSLASRSSYVQPTDATTPLTCVPQWKKDLIQRKKINITKSVSACQNSNLNIKATAKEGTITTCYESQDAYPLISDSKTSVITGIYNKKDNLTLLPSRINKINNENEKAIINKQSVASVTTKIDMNILQTPAALQFQQPNKEMESIGGHYTQDHIKSTEGCYRNYYENFQTSSAYILQDEQQEPVIQSVTVCVKEQNSSDVSSPTPQENVRLQKNLSEQPQLSASTYSDLLLTSTSRRNSILKLPTTATAEFNKKSHEDNYSSQMCVCAEQEQSRSYIFQQKPALTTTNTNKSTKQHNKIDGEINENEDEKKQFHNMHQLNSEREDDGLLCALSPNEFGAKFLNSKLFCQQNCHITNCNNPLHQLKSNTVQNKKKSGIQQINNNEKTSSSSESYYNNKINTKLPSNQNSNESSSIATTSSVFNKESPLNLINNRKKMVAVHQMKEITNHELDFDPSEELKYGPGIVSKLRCRYLGLALRQSMGKQRFSIDSLRRATSLNNLLDNNYAHDENFEEIQNDVLSPPDNYPHTFSSIKVCEPVTGLKENSNIYPAGQTIVTYDNHKRSRPIKRGNDSLKRARSVEALLCEKSAWNCLNNQMAALTNGAADLVTIEGKINNARERLSSGSDNIQLKRLTSIIDDTERPPPDLVKETLKIFEASSSRKDRIAYRNISGEVATKVANYKTILIKNKPAITFPKPPSCPKKPNQILQPISTEVDNTILSTSKTLQKTEKNTMKLSSALIASTRSNATNTMPFRSKLDFKPIENVAIGSSVDEVFSDYSPDIIPRLKLMEKSVIPVDSTVSELTKSTEKFLSSTTTIQTLVHQSPPQKDRHSRFLTDSTKCKSDCKIPEPISKDHISKSGRDVIANMGVSRQLSTNENTVILKPPATHGYTSTTIKQIGVIRPLLAESSQQQLKHNCIDEMFNNHSISYLTSREIEKNRINSEKKIEKPNSKSSIDNKQGCVLVAPKLNIISGTDIDNCSKAPWSSAIMFKNKWNASMSENNTMVFNFKDRKDVPDYIEHDGIIFKHKRELPKPNESGFVLLGDLSLETSTDPEEEWPMGPPSPCDVEFKNAHIIIGGKSSIKKRPKEANFRVQFNDILTSTFEYPSETSLSEELHSEYSEIIPNESEASTSTYESSANACHDQINFPIIHHHVKSEEIIQLPNNKILGNSALGSAHLSSYTPATGKNENIFELGVTRVPNSQSEKQDDGTSLNERQTADYYDELDKTSLEYLRPMSDDLTIAYSEGSVKTDLLY